MIRYTINRILWLIPILICVSFIIFGLLELAPGSIIDTMITEEMTTEDIEILKEKYGMDKPMIYRYGLYMWNLLHGDLGTSQVTGLPIFEMYMSRWPNTLMLSLSSLVVGVLIAIPLGIFAAKYAGTI